MKTRLSLVAALVLICVPGLALAQEAKVSRHPKAESLLSLAYSVMGGPNLAGIHDIYAQLTVRVPDGDTFKAYPATLKTLGNKMWRIEAQLPQGLSVIIVNGDRGASRAGFEETQPLPAISIAEAGNTLIPVLSILSEWFAPRLKLEYVGTEQEGALHHIRVQRTSEEEVMAEVLSPCDIYLDAQTLLPTKLVYSLHPPANLLVDLPVEVQYRDYRNVGGILVPFQVAYLVRGRLMNEYHVTSFTVNQGASEADFALR